MSRLDSFINRMVAQRTLLNSARERLADVPGVIFEFGLGNGRTFDHLREIFEDRDIYVFERNVHPHPTCLPDVEHLYAGEMDETLPEAVARFAGGVALVHADIGGPDKDHCAHMRNLVSEVIGPALAPGALVFGDLEFAIPGTEPDKLPDGVPPGRYYVYRRSTAS